MRTSRRDVFLWDGQRLTQGQIDRLTDHSERCDELVVAIVDAESGFTERAPLSGGQRIERLRAALHGQLACPAYFVPLKTSQLTSAQLVQRLRFDLPSFAQLVTWDAEIERAATALLACRCTLAPADDGPDLLASPSPLRRGLFVTRAQPFHRGHTACVQAICDEMDEVIVLVALAESSHSLRNPATAGERLEMIHPVLERILPGRYHLAAAPYEAHTACNMGELQLLLPSFECVYTNSPSTRALAISAGLDCRTVRPGLDVSASQVRKALIEDRPIGELVPAEVEQAIERLGLRQRLQLLASKEVR